MDTITKSIILSDSFGNIVKNLISGTTTYVKVHNTPTYTIKDKEFFYINNKNKQGD